VGGTKLIKANVRVLASTKINLLDKVGDGTFRQDLYYRWMCCGCAFRRCGHASRISRPW